MVTPSGSWRVSPSLLCLVSADDMVETLPARVTPIAHREVLELAGIGE
jgi:hypothetical protein